MKSTWEPVSDRLPKVELSRSLPNGIAVVVRVLDGPATWAGLPSANPACNRPKRLSGLLGDCQVSPLPDVDFVDRFEEDADVIDE